MQVTEAQLDLVEVKKTKTNKKKNFRKGRGTPDSRRNKSRGLRHSHDTLPSALSSISLSGSVLFPQIGFLREPREIFETSGKSSGPGD